MRRAGRPGQKGFQNLGKGGFKWRIAADESVSAFEKTAGSLSVYLRMNGPDRCEQGDINNLSLMKNPQSASLNHVYGDV